MPLATERITPLVESNGEKFCDTFPYSRGRAVSHSLHRVSEMIVLHDAALEGFFKGFSHMKEALVHSPSLMNGTIFEASAIVYRPLPALMYGERGAGVIRLRGWVTFSPVCFFGSPLC